MTSVMISPLGVPKLTSTPNKDGEDTAEFHSALEADGSLSSARTVHSGMGTPSPRAEAFVMTGDKILRLNSKLSTSYAKAQQSQLPSVIDVLADEEPDPVGLGPDRGHVVVSKRQPHNRAHSSDGLPEPPADTAARSALNAEEADPKQSSVTVNAMMNGRDSAAGRGPLRSPSVDSRVFAASEPASPAHATPASTSGPPVGVVSPTRQTEEGSEEREAAKRLAGRLFRLDGFHRSDVAVQLAQKTGFASLVGMEYGRLVNMGGLRLDAGLREFVSRVPLLGESGDRDRLLGHFSAAYAAANPNLFASADEVHTLAAALVLLNSDLHGPNIGKRMSAREFVRNVEEADVRVSPELLKNLYASIKAKALLPPKDLPNGDGKPKARPPQDRRFLDIPDPADQVDYKKGWLMRKAVAEEDGRRTPFGRRGWKMLYATVKGLVLYLHKDEHGFERKGAFATFQNSIRLHHAYASPFSRHTKRQNVFRLRTAGFGEYLFETTSPSEVDSWVSAVNLVAAQFSCAPLPAAVSSAGPSAAFVRPLLPSAVSQASLQDQLRVHQRAADSATEELGRLKANAPPLRGASNPAIRSFFYRERYLEEDIARYETYVRALAEQLRKSAQLRPAADRPALDPHDGGSNCEGGGTSTTESSGQSDRLSYRAAISATHTNNSSYDDVSHDL